MMSNPENTWKEISKRADWKNYILPRQYEDDFDFEGWVEFQRLMYLYDSNSTVIDYGCGIGRVLQYISQRARRAIGLDVTDKFIQHAQSYTENAEFYRSYEYGEVDIADLVYSLMVLQHNDTEHQKKIMDHIYFILKKGGTALVSFPRHESSYYRENEFLHKFTKHEVMEFGRRYKSYRIIEGNLPNYQHEIDDMNHEYFLVAVK